ncbi:hypothetical protein ACFQZ4_09945 [Catellatospora coxensis]
MAVMFSSSSFGLVLTTTAYPLHGPANPPTAADDHPTCPAPGRTSGQDTHDCQAGRWITDGR